MAGLNSLRDDDTTPEPKSHEKIWVAVLVIIGVALVAMAILSTGVTPNG